MVLVTTESGRSAYLDYNERPSDDFGFCKSCGADMLFHQPHKDDCTFLKEVQ